MKEFKVLNDRYPISEADFQAAKKPISKSSITCAAYCAIDNPTTKDWALIYSPNSGGRDIYRTSSGGVRNYIGEWDYEHSAWLFEQQVDVIDTQGDLTR